jgi:hypothetical protein
MTEADIRKAQMQIDVCRRDGSAVWLWRGEIHIGGAEPSKQRQAQIHKHEHAIRQLLGDDGRAREWAVTQLPGGSLLYQHPKFDTGERKPASEERQPIMPFGKYRGAPLDALVDDAAYVAWLLQQRWFSEKFPEHQRYLAAALSRTMNDAEGPNAA